MARPLELVNQKTCHGSINLTKKYQNHSCFSEKMKTIHSPLVNETGWVIM